MRSAVHVARMGDSRNAHTFSVGRPEGRRSLGRPRRRWEDNIKIDLHDVGLGGMGRIDLVRIGQVAGAC